MGRCASLRTCYAVLVFSAALAAESHPDTRSVCVRTHGDTRTGTLETRSADHTDTPKGGDKMAATPKLIRPEDLAATLGISGKVVRAYLRKTYPRPANAKGSTWVLSQAQATATLAYFKKRNPEAYAKAVKSRTKRTAKRTATTPTESA